MVYVHSAICETSVVYWYYLHLWSIGGDTSDQSICPFSYMLHEYSAVVFHRSLVNWMKGGFGICAFCYT